MYYQHPNEEGYKVIADSIGEYLLKEIHFGRKINKYTSNINLIGTVLF
jgi:hypothetical protein